MKLADMTSSRLLTVLPVADQGVQRANKLREDSIYGAQTSQDKDDI